MLRRFLISFSLIFSLLGGAVAEEVKQNEKPAIIFAASSLSGVLPALAEKYSNTAGKPAPVFSHAASAVLARQINQGAPADAFISANTQWIMAINVQGKSPPQKLVQNQLVVVAGRFSKFNVFASLNDIQQFGAIAVADKNISPLGQYSMQALTTIIDPLGIDAKLIPARDARATLRLVEHRATDAAIVYATSAKASKRVRVLHRIDPKLHDPILYQAITLSERSAAHGFINFLQSIEAIPIWQAYGFITAEPQEEKAEQ